MSQDARTLRKRRWRKLISLLLMGGTIAGCNPHKRLHYIGEPRELQYYEDQALHIEYPQSDDPTPESVAYSAAPRTLADRSHDELWEMTLAEAIHLALTNNKVIRTAVNPQAPTSNPILTNADNVPSIYDPAIRESGFLFGQRGVESALSAFDTQMTTKLNWNANSAVQNNAFFGNLPAGSTLDQDGATFTTGLQKAMAYGATLGLSHNVNYTRNNQPARFFHSAYDGNVQLTYRQPLLAGSGSEFTHIAGPIGDNIQGLTGVNQGVWIARINTDISLVDFESNVRNMLYDVERQYWDLYYAYRSYDAAVTRRNSSLRTWREVHTKSIIGAKGGGAADEAQSRETYFDSRSQAETALQTLYTAEIQLRRLCGLPVSDGRIIQPKDEPITAEFVPDWNVCLAEALTRREELRRQKWNVRSFELQYDAARNVARPRFDFVSGYQINGFGDELFNHDGPNPDANSADRFQSFYRSLTRANQDGWNFGVEFSMPFGLRNALAQMRNQELRLIRAREVLAAQELEVSHQLAGSFQTLASQYKLAQTNFNRRRAAERQLRAFEAEYTAGTKTLDLLLQAQTRLALAETAYYNSIVQYNKEISNIHYLKGTLLDNYNVHLSEGLWSPEAYQDALRRAWARTYAVPIPPADPVHQSPPTVSTGIPVQTETEVLGEEVAPLMNRAMPVMDGPGITPLEGEPAPVPPADGVPTPVPAPVLPAPTPIPPPMAQRNGFNTELAPTLPPRMGGLSPDLPPAIPPLPESAAGP